MKKRIFFILLVIFLFNLPAFSQKDLESLKEDYFKSYRYDDFVVYLKNLKKKRAFSEADLSYYIALTRYRQLKYLEEIQDWDNYFKYGNDYRDELVREVKRTIDLTSYKDKVHLYGYGLLWRFYKDQQSPQETDTKQALLEACSLYIKETTDIEPIKEIAHLFLSYEEKPAAERLFKLYAERLIDLEKDLEKLSIYASTALKENNLSLATLFYDAYIERIIKEYPKERILNQLISVARDFSFKSSGSYDLDYAETIFKRIESLFGKDVFDEETLSLRIDNLERLLDYHQLIEQYLNFLEKFPESRYVDKITFKTAIIYAYSLADLEKAKQYFIKLTEKQKVSSYTISALYQLGLLSQWQQDYSSAIQYYNKLKEMATDEFKELKELTEKRVEEIKNNNPLEYNLKTFLDLSFSKEKFFKTGTLNLTTSQIKTTQGNPIEISASVGLPESGCMQIEVSYLWSGELGSYIPSLKENSFSTTYNSSGTKLVNLVVVTAQGVLDFSYLMLDIE